MRLNGIGKRFGSALVLRDVTLEVRRGEALAIVGPSGSGKSTLLAIMGLLEPPSYGSLVLFGRPSETVSRERATIRREHMAWVFQNPTLFLHRTVAENVAIPLLIAGQRHDDALERAAEVLSDVGLASQAGARARLLSGGEKQRLEVARAIAQSGDLILCDEPTASLDRANAANVTRLIIERRPRNASVVIATHDQRVSQQCDRVLGLEDGVVRSNPGRTTNG